jgi:hypothetical protein
MDGSRATIEGALFRLRSFLMGEAFDAEIPPRPTDGAVVGQFGFL